MGIAYEFLKEEASASAGPIGFRKDFEGTINFIIDHYFELMGVHRAIQDQLEETDEKREKAHADLKAFRVKKKSFAGQKLSDAEKDALAAEEKDIKKRLTQEDKIIFKDEPLSEDDCRLNVVCRYSFLFTNLEKVDNLVRWPLRKCLSIITDNYPDLKKVIPKI